MTLVGKIRSRVYEAAINECAQQYAVALSDEERLAIQLDLWNQEWQRLVANVPYYRDLYKKQKLPSRFNTWQEFTDSIPISTRAMVQKHKKRMTSTEKPSDFVRMTGGSTAEPIQLPAWNSEQRFVNPDRWYARSWYGVSPHSRLFWIWGHSHLLGSGVKEWINAHKRELFDRLLGYYRFSAYDLQPAMLRRAAEELIEFKPEYMIGYSVALDLFARANLNLREELRNCNLKVVLGTAERFPSPDSVILLQDTFDCPVAMEYGSVETELVAHIHPSGEYRGFWRTYFVEAERSNAHPSAHTIRVTSLYPRCFPLVRYELGDEIELLDSSPSFTIGLARFKGVIGRCNDYVILSDGATIHSEVFTHVVRPSSQITSYQVVHDEDNITIRYTSSEHLASEELEQIRSRLAKVHPELAQVALVEVDKLQQTIAGKTLMVIRKQQRVRTAT